MSRLGVGRVEVQLCSLNLVDFAESEDCEIETGLAVDAITNTA